MNAKHHKTLQAVFKRPTSGSILFADLNALVTALGAHVREGSGSRVTWDFGGGNRLHLHRPHPGKEAKRYQVEELRDLLAILGVFP